MAAFLGIRYKGILGSGFALGQGGIILPSAASYDPAAVAYFTAVEDAGGTLTDNVKDEFNAFVVREKAGGRWGNIKRLYPYMGGVINSAIIDAVTTNAATNNNFVDADVDATIGLQGDAATKYLNTNISPLDLFTSVNDVQAFHFQEGTAGIGSDFMFASYDTAPTPERIFAFYDFANLFTAVGDPAILATVAGGMPASGINSAAGGRFGANDLRAYLNGANLSTNTSTSTNVLPSYDIFIFGGNQNGALNRATAQKGFGTMFAEGMSPDELLACESSYRTFINNIQAYAASQAYFAAVETAGGTLTTNVESEFSAFVSREVEANRWSKIKRLYPFMGGTIDAARIDAITGIQATNTNFVDADADATIGLQGDGSTKSLRLTETTNLILPDSTDFQIGVFRIGAVEQPSSLSRLMGHFSSANSLGRLYLQKNQLQPQVFATDNVVAAGGVLSTNSSHIGASFSSSDLNVLLDGVVVNTNSTARSTPFSTDLMDLFALNINGTPSSFSSIKSGGMFIASGLSLTETQAFESSYKTFINNIQAYAALMDSYSGAAAAYSLRKVYSTYEGSAINVRRSSDNATQDIGFDGYILDEAALLSFVGAGDGYVTTWYDQSGNGNDATQSTASNQPQIVSSGSTITFNGKSGVDFGAGDLLTCTLSTAITQPSTYYTVFENAQAAGTQRHYVEISDPNYVIGKSVLDKPFQYAGTFLYGATTLTTGAQYLQSGLFNTSSSILRLNGAQDASGNNGALTSATAMSIGGNGANPIIGIIQEYIAYNTDESSEFSNVESKINTYYNIY